MEEDFTILSIDKELISVLISKLIYNTGSQDETFMAKTFSQQLNGMDEDKFTKVSQEIKELMIESQKQRYANIHKLREIVMQ